LLYFVAAARAAKHPAVSGNQPSSISGSTAKDAKIATDKKAASDTDDYHDALYPGAA